MNRSCCLKSMRMGVIGQLPACTLQSVRSAQLLLLHMPACKRR